MKLNFTEFINRFTCALYYSLKLIFKIYSTFWKKWIDIVWYLSFKIKQYRFLFPPFFRFHHWYPSSTFKPPNKVARPKPSYWISFFGPNFFCSFSLLHLLVSNCFHVIIFAIALLHHLNPYRILHFFTFKASKREISILNLALFAVLWNLTFFGLIINFRQNKKY